MNDSDEDLATRAGAGDPAAFEVLLERHYDRVYRVALRVSGQVTDAQDVAQDVCLALPAKLKGFRGEARFTTWLHRVTLNAARDRIRRNVTRGRAAAGWGDFERDRRAAADLAAEEQDWLMQAMEALSPLLRETVALVLGEDMTHAEASAVLGVSEGTVSWRMSEVRKMLAEMARTQELLT